MKDSKKLIKILIIFISILVIALIGVIIISLTTDIFKSDKQSFESYLQKGMEKIDYFTDISNEKQYYNFLKNNQYNENTNGVITYTNSSDIQEQFDISVQGSTNGQENNSYRKLNVKYGENTDITNIEFLQENEKYGILFADVVKQFVSIDLSDKKAIIKKLNIDEKKIDDLINNPIIKDFVSIIGEERENIKKIIKDYKSNIQKNQYTIEKGKTIALSDGNNVEATEYSVKLTSDQTRRFIRNILRQLKDEENIEKITSQNEQIGNLKLSFYAKDGKLVRIGLEYNNNSINLDIYENELDIVYNEKEIEIKITKNEKAKAIEYIDMYNNNYNIETETEFNESQGNVKINLNAKNDYLKGLNIKLEQQLEVSKDIVIEKKFDSIGNVNLSELEENRINNALTTLFRMLNDNIEKTQNKNINSELVDKWISINKEIQNKYIKLQNSIENKFNNQFLMYQGQNVDKNIIFNLIDVIGKNIKGYSVNNKNELKIYLQEGKTDKEMTAKLKEIVGEGKGNYNVNFEYDVNKKISIIFLELYEKKQ